MSGSKRPKGYMNYSPSNDVADIIYNTQAILREYGAYGPMTVRQVFYRLVGNYGYDKTERAYKRLAEYLVKARRAQMIPFGSIRDDGGTVAGGSGGYDGVDSFVSALARYGDYYSLPADMGQPNHIELWCEAEGMVPMLAQMARSYGVQVTGTGGFSSLTVIESMARRIVRRADDDEQVTVLLHVGDHDPSGVSIFASMCQDIGAFVSGITDEPFNERTGAVARYFAPCRIAVTAEQGDEYGLDTAPPKQSDSRSVGWRGETIQAEALPPDTLAAIVQGAVSAYWDYDVADELTAREAAEREVIGAKITEAVEALRAPLNAAVAALDY